MQSVLIVLAVILLVLVGLVLFVFLSAARTFVSNPQGEQLPQGGADRRRYVTRAREDRRTGERRAHLGEVGFPLVDCNGVLVEYDRRRGERRSGTDRRSPA